MALILESVKREKEVAVNDAITRLVETNMQISALKKTKEQLEFIIKSAMGDNEDLYNADGDKLATWKYSDRSSIDAKALAEAHPEIAKEFTVVKKVRTFRC